MFGVIIEPSVLIRMDVCVWVGSALCLVCVLGVVYQHAQPWCFVCVLGVVYQHAQPWCLVCVFGVVYQHAQPWCFVCVLGVVYIPCALSMYMYVCVSLQEESVKEKKGAAVTTAEQEQRSPLQSVPEDAVVPQPSPPTTPEKGRETAGEFPRSPVKEEHSSGVEQLGDQPASSSTLERPQSSVQDVFEPPKPPSRPPSSVGFPSPSKPQKPADYAGEPPPRTMRERQQSESAKRPLAPPTLWSSIVDHFLHFYDIIHKLVSLSW